MNRFLAAVRFLTIVPISGKRGCDTSEMAGSALFFPVVGLLIGALAVAAVFLLAGVFPPWLVAVLVVVLLGAVSGAFHLDGLADTADAFMSSRPKEKMLEIMKDSRIGVMGLAAVIWVFAVKVAALASLDRDLLWRAALLAPLAGRCAMVLALAILPSARAGGLGELFCKGARPMHAVFAGVALFAAGWLAARYAGVIVAGAATLTALVLSAHTYRKIRGATGDTLGATCEITEAVVALVFAVKPLEALIGG